MGDTAVKAKAFSKMFVRSTKNWKKDIKVEEVNADSYDDCNSVQDAEYEEAEVFDDQSESNDNKIIGISEIKADIDMVEDRQDIKNEEKKEKSSLEIETVKKINDVSRKDITTAMKENDKLSEDIRCLESMLADSEREVEKYKHSNKELKSIVIGFGLNGDFELFENIKIELKEKSKEVEQLKVAVSKNNDYHEKLKNSLFLGMQELFEKNPAEKAALQETKENIGLIQEPPAEKDQIQEPTAENDQNIDNEVVEKVMKMFKADKTIIQIKFQTKLSNKEIEKIIKKEGGGLENVS